MALSSAACIPLSTTVRHLEYMPSAMPSVAPRNDGSIHSAFGSSASHPPTAVAPFSSRRRFCAAAPAPAASAAPAGRSPWPFMALMCLLESSVRSRSITSSPAARRLRCAALRSLSSTTTGAATSAPPSAPAAAPGAPGLGSSGSSAPASKSGMSGSPKSSSNAGASGASRSGSAKWSSAPAPPLRSVSGVAPGTWPGTAAPSSSASGKRSSSSAPSPSGRARRASGSSPYAPSAPYAEAPKP
mmetsp:Transcript_3125/g.12675  ORF Transcript_3125/g.12675 Transcript_3125/m.12675 type:complete len:243 (+) Transcript_3125:692-1420(+)